MLEFAQSLYLELENELDMKDMNQDANHAGSEDQIALILTRIGQLKEKLREIPFATEEEEIQFFKHLFPQFLSLFIYYTEKIELDCMQFLPSSKSRTEYIEWQSARIDLFLKENMEFFKYYQSGKTHFDSTYFLRGHSAQRQSTDLLAIVIDPLFCTTYSVSAARIIAFSKLEIDIRHMTEELDSLRQSRTRGKRLIWTASKTELIELIYSLHAQGVIDEGKATLKTIATYFESVFSIRLGNISSAFQKLLRRKGGRLNFIKQLETTLTNRIDEIEGDSIRK